MKTNKGLRKGKTGSWVAAETAKLAASWEQHDAQMLRDYLVAGVEDPRINMQSMLTRHFLLEAICGPEAGELMREELRFGCVVNWLLQLFTQPIGAEDLRLVRHALQVKGDEAEGISIPGFLSEAYAALPRKVGAVAVPNYVDEILGRLIAAGKRPALAAEDFAYFQNLWAAALAGRKGPTVSVLEPACGSANDYRFFEAYGLARFLDYRGFDLSAKNIANARAMFPGVNFATGNALKIAGRARAYDFTVVHDLFEHLSLAAMEQAVAEICRVTRWGISVGFFNMTEAEEHVVNPLEQYHWNTLAMERMRELFAGHGFAGHVLHIGTLVRAEFGCPGTHNLSAYTFQLARGDAPKP